MHQGLCESTMVLDRDGLDGILVVAEDPSVDSLQHGMSETHQSSKSIGGPAKKILGGGILIVVFVLLPICFFLFQTNQQRSERQPDQATIAANRMPQSSLSKSLIETADHQIDTQYPIEDRTGFLGKSIESPVPILDRDILESRPIEIQETDRHSVTGGKKTVLGSLTDPKRDNQVTSEQLDGLVAQTIESGEVTLQPTESEAPDSESHLSSPSEVPEIDAVVISEFEFPVRFSFGSSTLGSVSNQYRASIKGYLAGCGDELQIVGQTCDVGAKAYNRILGMARAKAVKRFLVGMTKFSGSYVTLSEGADNSDLPNSTRRERAQNRRVVLRCFAR